MSRVHFRAPAEEALLLCVFYAQSHQLQAIETMSLSSLTFKKNDRVEALWLEDGKWYPAEVIQVKPHNVYRIRFDGFVEEYDRPKDELRVGCVIGELNKTSIRAFVSTQPLAHQPRLQPC